ncbi:MAG: RsmE family RNA methyltransferase [Anaerolineae bacterium]|nr:RsmE family RNA methyltransferase [Anaerolineae bacterium]
MKLTEALAQHGAERAIISWEGADTATAVHLNSRLTGKTPQSIALFIGPEGGFASEEIKMARQYNVQPVTLGKRILRAETAAIVVPFLLFYGMIE